jgi:hypothetical protein
MSSKLSEAQDAFFQAFAVMTKKDRVLFANHAMKAYFAPDAEYDRVALAVHELLALSDAIAAEPGDP